MHTAAEHSRRKFCQRSTLLLVAALAAPALAADEGTQPAPLPAAPVRAKDAPMVYLTGDSTMADKPTDPPNPEHGWGQMLPGFFKDPAMISNHAMNGRSSKSFLAEGRWQVVLDALQPGDWVIIQFGHNDEKIKDTTRGTDPQGGFRENLRRYVRETRGKGAHPVLATCVVRRSWHAEGLKMVDTHGDYPAATRAVATEEKVPLLEMHDLTRELETGHGPEGSKRLHLWLPPGADSRHPAGRKDDTHYSAYGATRVAALAVQEILRLQLPLAEWVK